MYLTYTEFFQAFIHADDRTNNTSFTNARGIVNGEPSLGCAKAMADGALVLNTSKVKNKNKYCKQRCALSFEGFSM